MTITTDAEAIQYLASMEVDCPECGGEKHQFHEYYDIVRGSCSKCAGSAKVRRFPGLSKVCHHGLPVNDKTGPGQYTTVIVRHCWDCWGSGLVPIPIPDAVLYLMGQTEFHSIVFIAQRGLFGFEEQKYRATWAFGKNFPRHEDAPTIIQALARAIAAAEEENASL